MGSTIEEKLSELRRNYAETLPGKVRDLEAAWDCLPAQGWDAAELRHLHIGVHGVAGTGATLGFRELSDLAKQLELIIEDLLDQGRPAGAEEQTRVRQLLALLHKATAAPAGDTRPAPTLPDAHWSSTPPAGGEIRTVPTRRGRRIVLAERASDNAGEIAHQLGHFGYEVEVVADAESLSAAARHKPAVIITAVDLAEAWLAEDTDRLATERPPVIYIGSSGALTTRLRAVRAGGAAYFVRPIQVGPLVDVLDRLTAEEPPEPYRVLVVDDEPAAAAHAALVLEHAGMRVRTVSNPLAVSDVLDELHPDLILMDLYMPECSGLELAQVIRQQEEYVGIPILFLSADRDRERQLAAIRHGGDDFLTKPVDDEHLRVQVAARARRSRAVRAAMVRDALTGLPNHTRIQEQLDLDLQRARRDHRSLAYAMLDIDLFKQVNDSYGHPTGDRVIKTLARLLQQRLRRSDVVGRYGGEEFAVILPDTTAAAAAQVLDAVRAAFAAIHHRCDTADFTVTISGGVAEFPHSVDAQHLREAADRALYAAKHAGRNRIVVAG